MKLYYDKLLNPRKACAAARHLETRFDEPVEFIRCDVRTGAHKTPDFLAKNPNGQLPRLEDGAFSLWESNAIMCYLARKAGSDFWPRDEKGQIETIRWLSWDGAHFSRHGGALYFEFVIKPKFRIGPPDDAIVAEATEALQRYAAVLDTHLATREFMVGDHVSVCDFALGVSLAYPEATARALSDFAHIARWNARLNQFPGWRDPFPAQPVKTA